MAVEDVTKLLLEWRSGSSEALDKLIPLVYDELRRIAHRYARRTGEGESLQTTALVNEAYLRLVGRHGVDWQCRAHFFGVAAQVMRGLLIDRARSRQTVKRGGDPRRVELEDIAVISRDRDAELIALDDALKKLASNDERKSRIVEMRYFGGLSVDETADVIGVSPITVKREWLKAKAWLYRELTRSSGAPEE